MERGREESSHCRARAPAAGAPGSLQREPPGSLRGWGPRTKEVCLDAGGRGSVRLPTPRQPPESGPGVPPGGRCRGVRRLGCGGWELPSVERAKRSAAAGPGRGRSIEAAAPRSPGFALGRRRGSRLPSPGAALRPWQLTVSPAPASLVLCQPGATAIPGLRKALGRSAGWVAIQLLTCDPVRPAF